MSAGGITYTSRLHFIYATFPDGVTIYWTGSVGGMRPLLDDIAREQRAKLEANDGESIYYLGVGWGQ